MILQSFQTSIRLKDVLAAPSVIFTRRRNYGYASSQEITASTHHNDFYMSKGDLN